MNNVQNGYYDAVQWADVDDDPDIDQDADWSATMRDEAERACAQFVARAWPFFEEHQAYQVGVDFWLTRQGHGVGFWDGDWPHTREALTLIADSFSSLTVYSHKGLLYTEHDRGPRGPDTEQARFAQFVVGYTSAARLVLFDGGRGTTVTTFDPQATARTHRACAAFVASMSASIGPNACTAGGAFFLTRNEERDAFNDPLWGDAGPVLRAAAQAFPGDYFPEH